MTIEKAVIPAAGYGTRARPLSKAVPKELFPVDEYDRPVIHYVVKEALDAGIDKIGIITRDEKKIRKYFEEDMNKEKLRQKGERELLKDVEKVEDMGKHIEYIEQKEQEGLGHAVLQAKDFVKGDDFAVLFGDSFFNVYEEENPLKDMIELYEELDGASIVGAEIYEGEEASSHGMMEVEKIREGLYDILDLEEKPKDWRKYSNKGTSCRDILTSGIMETLEETEYGKGNELQLTDAIANNIKENGEKAYAYVLPYQRYHVSRRGDRFEAEKSISGL